MPYKFIKNLPEFDGKGHCQWLDFYSADGLYSDVLRTTPVSAGSDPISIAESHCPGNYGVIQSADLSRPTWESAVQNGGGACFGGGALATLYMTLENALPIRSAFTWIGVVRLTNAATTANLYGGDASGLRIEATAGQVLRAVNDGVATLSTSGAALTADTARLVTLIVPGNGTSQFRITAADVSTTHNANALCTGNVTHFMSNRTPALYWEDYVHETFLFSRGLLLDSEIKPIERYLREKWAV